LSAGGGFGGAGYFGLFVFCPLFEEDLFEGLFVGCGMEFGDRGEWTVGRVFDDIFNRLNSLRGLFGEVGAGDLEAVEHEAGALVVDVVGGEAAEDFSDGELDGGAVFGFGQAEGGLFAAAEG
jgi:hypothetical protein